MTAPSVTLSPRGAAAATQAMAVRERSRIDDLLAGEFPSMPAPDRERCADEAFDYLYADGNGPLVGVPAGFRAQWLKIARLRALRECRRRRHRVRSRLSVSDGRHAAEIELGGADRARRNSVLDEIEARRAEYRAQELLASLAPEPRALAEALYGADPDKRAPRHLRGQFEQWSARHYESVVTELRKQMRALLAARESGELCGQRREMLDEYLTWSLAVRAAGAGVQPEALADSPQFRPLWLHLEHCDACRAQARRVHVLEGEVQHALAAPPALLALWLAALARRAVAVKAKATATAATLMPARVRAAGGGGGVTGAALGGVGSKVAACAAGAALCASAGIIATGAVPLLTHEHAAHHHRIAHRAVATESTSDPIPGASVTLPAPALAVVHQRRPSAPPLVFTPVAESPPPAHLPTEPPAAHAASANGQEGAVGCSAPGDLGC